MSTGRKEAKRAARDATDAANQARAERQILEEKRRKEKERANRLFVRQIRARQGGGFSDYPGNTLG